MSYNQDNLSTKFGAELKRRLEGGLGHRLDGAGHVVGGGFLRLARAHTVIGLPGAGKSMVLCHLAICLRTGEKFFGRPVKKSKVAFFAAEACVSTLDRLIVAAKRAGLPWPIEGLSVIPGGLDLKAPNQLTAVIALINALGAEVVMIDTANASGSGDEGPGDMSAYASALNRVVMETGAALLVSHHTPVSGNPRERGHGSLRGLLDVSAFVEKEKHGDDRRLSIGKARDGEEELFGAFQIEGEKLGETNLGEAWVVPYLVETAVKPSTTTDAKPEVGVKQTKLDEWLVRRIIMDLCGGPGGEVERTAVHEEFRKRSKTPVRSDAAKRNKCNAGLAVLESIGAITASSVKEEDEEGRDRTVKFVTLQRDLDAEK